MTTQEISIAEGNKIIAEFMGYVYFEENVTYETDVWYATENIYSSVPIIVDTTPEGDKSFAVLANPDYKNPNPKKWNSELKTLGWETVNYGKYLTKLQYHSSWSWLMPVVEKIEGLYNGDFAIEITLVTCRIYRISELLCQYAYFDITYNGQSKIDSVYNAVIQFIQWYNNQNKK